MAWSLKTQIESIGSVCVVASSTTHLAKLRSGRAISVVLVDRTLDDSELQELARESSTSSFVTFGRSGPSIALEKVESLVSHRLRDPLALEDLENLLDHMDDFETRTPDRGGAAHWSCSLIGKSQCIRDLEHLINRIAPSNSSVLITGELGTGKETVARKIHDLSNQRAGPFVLANCAAIPPDILESQLFGHRKGAFTGAVTDEVGHFALAAGGTLYLDEICEMPLAIQAKLLDVLEQGLTRPIGGDKPSRITARLLTATDQDIEKRIEHGFFRQDLYAQLNEVSVHVPTVRERQEDIPQLVTELSMRLKQKHGFQIRLTSEALDSLESYDWPGNMRELASLVECLAVICPDGVADVVDLPMRYRSEIVPVRENAPNSSFLPKNQID